MLSKQKGAALITALLITAVVAAIATIMEFRQAVEIHDASLGMNADRLYTTLEGAEDWAEMNILMAQTQAMNNKQPEYRYIKYPLSLPSDNPLFPPNLQASIIPATGKFNINALGYPTHRPMFTHLLKLVVPDLTDSQANNITNNVADWVGPSNADEIYLLKKPPYRAPHTAMGTISELLLIDGITPKIYSALKPYIIALPTTDLKINPIFAPKQVLMSLSSGRPYSESQVEELKACVKSAFQQDIPPAENMNDFYKSLLTRCLKTSQIPAGNLTNFLTLQNNYFLFNGIIKQNGQMMTLSSLLKRYTLDARTQRGQQKRAFVSVIWQARNAMSNFEKVPMSQND